MARDADSELRSYESARLYLETISRRVEADRPIFPHLRGTNRPPRITDLRMQKIEVEYFPQVSFDVNIGQK